MFWSMQCFHGLTQGRHCAIMHTCALSKSQNLKCEIPMPVTIKDIAKAAGVSHSTVSRALNGHPGISTKTTARIQQLAREMGYAPSAVAQSLLAQRTHTIGMVVTTIADPFITRVVAGVETVAQSAGYSVFLSASHNDPAQELAVVKTFHRRRVDAVIVTASRVGSLYGSELGKIHVPVVLINNQEEGEYLYSVAVDDVHGAQLAVEHLLSLGHRRIGFVGNANRPVAKRRRLAGYRAALQQAGVHFDPALVFVDREGADYDIGVAVLPGLLRQGVTAVFGYTDMIAISLMNACRRYGITAPKDMSVVGFDDIEAARFVYPPLTTVHQPRQQLGWLAMQMTLDLLDGKNVTNKTLSCGLVVRQSTQAFNH